MFEPTAIALVLLIGLQLFPILFAIHRRRINFLSVVMAGNFVAFSANKLYELFSGVDPSRWPTDVRVELYALVVAHVLIILGYVLTSKKFRERTSSQTLAPSRLKGWEAVASSLLIAWIALAPLSVGLKQLAIALQSLLMVYLFFSEAPENPIYLGFARACLWLTALLVFIQYGLLSFAVALTILGAIRCLMWRKVAHAISLILLVAVMGTLQPIKSAHRNFLLRRPQSSVVERVENTIHLFEARWITSASEKPLPIAQTSRHEEYWRGFRRVGDDSLGKVLTQTPDRVPYWRGETYRPLLFVWLPRLFWTKKPEITTWHKFGKEYGYLQSTDEATSVSFNYLAEAFMNFGIRAFLAASLLFGAIIALTERTLVHLLPGQPAVTFALFVLPFAVPTDTTSIVAPILFSALLLGSSRTLPRLFIRARKLLRPAPLRSLISRGSPFAE